MFDSGKRMLSYIEYQNSRTEFRTTSKETVVSALIVDAQRHSYRMETAAIHDEAFEAAFLVMSD